MSSSPSNQSAQRKSANTSPEPRKGSPGGGARRPIPPQLQIAPLLLASLGVLAVAGCKSRSELEQPRPDDYNLVSNPTPASPLQQPIRPGDILEISVLEDPTLGGSYTVRAEGHIMMPSVGPRVTVVGMSVSGAEQYIKRILEQKKLRTATVTLDRLFIAPLPPMADKQQTLVYLTGKVARPGQHVLSTEIGVPLGAYEAIMITGGLGRFADGKNAHVMRQAPGGARRKIALDLDAVANGEERDLPLRKGDIVVVPEKVFGF